MVSQFPSSGGGGELGYYLRSNHSDGLVVYLHL